MTDDAPVNDLARTRTERLHLDLPEPSDAQALHALSSDPRVWTHFPSLRETDPETSVRAIAQWRTGWERDGLGVWIVREAASAPLIGYCGCRIIDGSWWNLGYRFTPASQGHGYATEAARAALDAAHRVRPELPVVAYLVEHNTASAKVAERLGLTIRHRGPEPKHPEPEAVRVVCADRELSAEQLVSVLA